MRDVAIVATAMTRFGELWESSLRDLFVEAAVEALRGAKLDRLDSIYVGNMAAGQFVGQERLGPLMAALRLLGLRRCGRASRSAPPICARHFPSCAGSSSSSASSATRSSRTRASSTRTPTPARAGSGGTTRSAPAIAA